MKKFITVFLLILLCLGVGAGYAVGKYSNEGIVAYAEQDDSQIKTKTEQINVDAYKLEDNTGYRESENKKVSASQHPLKSNLINLSINTQSDISNPQIDTGNYCGYNAYGIAGNYVCLQLSYNFDNSQNLYETSFYQNGHKKTRVYSISNDTAQQVGDIDRLGVVGTGALIFQKKTNPNGNWEWQTKDGETKKSLHTVNFTDLAPLDEYSDGEKYTIYTPSGTDLSKGVFIKITFAYEIKITTTWSEKNWLGVTKTKTETSYINMLETSEFYLVQNSGTVLFHNASNFDKVGDDDGSGAISINDFETILDGDVTLNGFRIDTVGVEAYDIKYRHNGGAEQSASDGQFFMAQGRYDFTIIRDIGDSITHTIFVDRREVNDAVVGYFGQSLFTPESQRIYTTGEYPAYIAGKATWNLNATDGTVAPVVGKLYKIVGEGEEQFIREIAQPYGKDYKTEILQGTIYEKGIYKAEFWGNPRYLSDGDISGDLYHFTFRFEIVDEDTSKEPSINEAYLNGLLSFCDMQSRYYAVTMRTKGAGNAIFAFSDFGGAYDFAYEIQRGKVEKYQNYYKYNGKTYTTQKAVLEAVDEIAKSLVSVRYFDSTNPESYQTADIADDKISEMNFAKDVIVFLNDTEQSYMQSGLPTLNARKYRYLSENGEIQQGEMNFAFLKVADFESNCVTLTHKSTGKVFSIEYGVSVEYQLGLANAPSGVYTVSEKNKYNAVSEYDAMYIRPGEMTGSAIIDLYLNGEMNQKTFDKDNKLTQSGLSGFIIRSLSNELDIYSIIKIKHDGAETIYSFDEVSDMWFAEGGVYDIVLADRLGNTVEFSLIINKPVGYVDVYLQLEQPDDEIVKHYHVFVGQEIQLPIPKLESDLYVFDGWLYEDKIITDNVFVPTVGGKLYIWQQVTQKYTYLNFDADGGENVDRIKVEIGQSVVLPSTTKEGWTFGGWEYGGGVYVDEYVATSASPTFVAIWHYQITEIELYDGNLTQKIDAHVGEKVVLPFPERTGYTFFGWREQQSQEQSKVYYGQITSLANTDYLRLDALWTRNSGEDLDNLQGGTGGRAMIHFVDGELLTNDSLQGVAGSTIALPKVTRAGFIFVGWIWEATSLSGKIYDGDTMTVPSGAGNKIVLKALWIARGTTTQSNSNVAISNTNSIVDKLSPASPALGGMIAMLGLIVAMCLAYAVKLKKKSFNGNLNTSSICGRDSFADKQIIMQRRIRRYSALTLLTALTLVILLTFLSAFGGWGDMGVFQKLNKEISITQVESQENTVDNNVIGNTFELDSANQTSDETKPTKDDVISNIQDSGVFETDGLDLTDDEIFLYSLIMLDLNSLGYTVFPAEAILPNKDRVLGFGYTDYASGYNSKDETDKTVYVESGFVALPRQIDINEKDIEKGIYLDVAYDESDILENGQYEDKEKVQYVFAFTKGYGPCHYIADSKYVIYSIDQWKVVYSSANADEIEYNSECGALYDYDLGRIVFDPNLGKESNIKATSLNTLLEPSIAKGEYDKYIADQTANGFTVDTLNFVYISYDALQAYQLNGQDESFLGIDVQEFYDMEKTLGSNEYYTVDKDGNLTKLEFPHKEEDKASWLDRLAGAVVAIGMICVGVIIVAAVSAVSCGAATAAAPYIMGAFIGAGMEVFMQTVVQGKKLDQVNWLRVGIAAVSGVLSAIPGVGWLGAGLISGGTEAAMTWAEGGGIEDILKSFTVGFATGVLIHGVGKALGKMKFCFVAGTPVLMAGGALKAIEDVRIGDKVKSYNAATGKVQEKRVLQTFVNETDELVTISTSDGQYITSTPGHKFYANNDWVSAEDLRAGDILVNVNGKKVIVEQVQHEILDAPVKVYNFEVADNHTYFVGDNDGVAVHNSACNKESGAYLFKMKFKDGSTAWYVGKGSETRMNVSIRQKMNKYKGEIIFEHFEPIKNSKDAFIQEAKWMNELAEQGNNLLNKIASPGFKKGGIQVSEAFKDHILKQWYKLV